MEVNGIASRGLVRSGMGAFRPLNTGSVRFGPLGCVLVSLGKGLFQPQIKVRFGYVRSGSVICGIVSHCLVWACLRHFCMVVLGADGTVRYGQPRCVEVWLGLVKVGDRGNLITNFLILVKISKYN